jgi:hypothetical protein
VFALLAFGLTLVAERSCLIMATGSSKVPPAFNEDIDDYDVWRKDIELWTSFTDLPEKKHAIAVHLSLKGRSRAASSELSVEDLKNDRGLEKLFLKLDRVFLQDPNWKCFNTYLAFENYNRPKDCSIDEYLSEFDSRHHKLKECKVILPDAVVACRLLKSCNLLDMHFQLALSTTRKMTFEDMRATLKKLFAESSHLLTAGSDSSVKVEQYVMPTDALYSSNVRGRWRGSNQRNRSSAGNGFFNKNQSNNTNPLKADGSVSLCAVCGSRMHWARKCPHAYEGRSSASAFYSDKQPTSTEEEVQVTLMASENNFDSNMDTLLGESFGSVLLDSGCSKTVCGNKWLSFYLDTLSEEDKQRVHYENSRAAFRFGDGVRKVSQKCVLLPCVLAGVNINIRSDVVDCDIPLLLSKASMKKAGMVIDMVSDTVQVFGKRLKLGSTSIGHYILPIYHPPTKERIEHILISGAEKNNSKLIALKLHRQFAHPSTVKLVQLLKDAGKDSRSLVDAVENVTETCETCRRYKKQRPRPVVAMSMAKTFNETVAMDLKIWQNGVYFLVLVDIATRFCSAVVINDKCANTIVRALFVNWIKIFGAPRQFMSDNGGEFNNEVMRSLANGFGIKLVCTAAESPWSNSICERLNCIIGISVRKIVDDCKCDVDTALSWAISARNALHNCHGYSPNQLVFGYNPVLPSVFSDSVSVLENRTSSQLIADNLNAMQSARSEFIKNESNEKIRRALLHQVRHTDVDDLANGDNVFYKRNKDDRWEGPGIVIGKDGKQVLVRHGGIYVRVHICRLQYAPLSQSMSDLCDPESKTVLDSAEEGRKVSSQMNKEESRAQDVESDDEAHSQPEQTRETSDFVTPSRSSACRPIVGKRIECWPKDEDKFTAKVISRAGKAGGLYGACYNIQRDDGEIEWIDLARQVEKWRLVPDNEEVLINVCDSEILEAKKLEILNWKSNGVFDEVDDNGQESISVRWVITEKIKDNISVVKTRLVARGFEEDLYDQRTDSPTCSKDSLRLAMTIIAAHGWTCNSIDVKSAFLQGENINREVYIRPPKEFYNGSLWKLNKTVYGLCDAARAWYFRVKKVLSDLGMIMCSLDQALFYWFDKEVLSGIVCIHVDDFCWAGAHSFEAVIQSLRKQFLIGSHNIRNFKYVGVNIFQRDDSSICIDQHEYIKGLNEIKLPKNATRLDELNKHDRDEYRAVVGQLNWVATQTRPDIAFEVCQLSSVFETSKIENLVSVNKVIRKVKSEVVTLCYPVLENIKECSIECYSDASFGNLCDGGSQGGYIVFIVDCNGRKCPITWQSKRVRRVVKSTLAAETLALLDSAEAGLYIAKLLSESLNDTAISVTVKCFVDNRSLVDALYSTKAVEDKYLRINIAVLRDMLSKHDLHSVSWVRSAHQLANVLTKRGASGASLIAAISDATIPW